MIYYKEIKFIKIINLKRRFSFKWIANFLLLGATAQDELWPPEQSASILLYFPRLTVWFLNILVFMV
jgi:hypothetical protein